MLFDDKTHFLPVFKLFCELQITYTTEKSWQHKSNVDMLGVKLK